MPPKRKAASRKRKTNGVSASQTSLIADGFSAGFGESSGQASDEDDDRLLKAKSKNQSEPEYEPIEMPMVRLSSAGLDLQVDLTSTVARLSFKPCNGSKFLRFKDSTYFKKGRF